MKQEDNKRPPEADHQNMKRAEGGTEGRHIPDRDFHEHLGREHTFRIGHPTVVEGQPRFQYGGYWFVIAQPWPVGWSYEDAVYIDFIDGVYYVIDPVHPGVQIVVNVVF